MAQSAKKLYVIANSHMDPIWIWGRASGQYTWLNTAHSVVKILKRHPELKFSCSSSAMYRCIEENAPGLFEEIRALVRAGRWEIVGGWEVQADAVITDTEALIRQGQSGRQYFKDKFGVDVKIGYCVDSFGHSAHLPKIFNATGFTHYVFLRPMSHQTKLPLLFDWRAEDGSTVRALRIFDTYNYENCGKEEFLDRIDANAAGGLLHQPLFFGVGDHGGGIYEKHLAWLQEAAEKYDIHFATLSEYFEAVKNEPVMVVENEELGPVFRGCYSANYETKEKITLLRERLCVAEKMGADAQTLQKPWLEELFHNFHDVMSGTASYQATENDVLPALGGALFTANQTIVDGLCRRSSSLDTGFLTEGGVYLWNPGNTDTQGVVAVEGFTDPNESGRDFNALVDAKGKVYPLQNDYRASAVFGPCASPWAKLTASVALKANEETVLAYAKVPEFTGKLGFDRQYQALKKIQFLRFHDDSGTWGFTLEKFIRPEDTAELVKTEELADGAVFSVLRAFFKLNNSAIRLDITRFAGIDELKLELRLEWHERLSVLKIAYSILNSDTKFYCGTPGGMICRYQPRYPQRAVQIIGGRRYPLYPGTGEVSMTEWCGVNRDGKTTAMYARALHSCDYEEGAVRLTLLRTVPYVDHHPFPRNEDTGYQDMGLQFRELWLLEDAEVAPETLPLKARKRLGNIECAEITAHGICADAPKPDFPIVQCSEKIVVESAHRLENGRWELHILNYGDKETVTLPDGRKEEIPAKALRIMEC